MSRHLALSALLTLAVLVPAPAQEGIPQGPSVPDDKLQILKDAVGTWEAHQKIRMSPEQPWMETKGTEVVKSVCNGLWIQSVFNTDMMGQPYEGRMTLGYDPYKKKFVGTWIDSYTPVLSNMTGTYDADSKTMTFQTEMLDPATGEMGMVKMTSTQKSKDETVFRMYAPGEGDQKEWLNMEITYKRKK